jgi:prepilin-type N-terminal cleavage/methylation domain-containing protein
MRINKNVMNISKHGFTLIELSIVLVIIGLIVGGILVGRDLISAAAVRAQISQIERYHTAANTFRTKYAYLPGDIPNTCTVYSYPNLTVWQVYNIDKKNGRWLPAIG